MRRIAWVLVAAALSVRSMAVQTQQQAGRDLSWAFPVMNGTLPAEEPGPKSVPGSTKTYTPQQIDDLLNPPDWFPDEHPAPPPIVQKGHADALACGSCHLMSGLGHPESADLTGMTAAYITRQMTDFKSGVRKDSARMNTIAKDVSDDEARQAAEWFAALKPAAWTKVLEGAAPPKTMVVGGRMRVLLPAGGTEPIGDRIITVPQDLERARRRDPHIGFTAYAPVGSIAKGKALVETGGSGRTIACAICHGDALKGLGNVPRLAGQHPIYIARQLYLFKDGTRKGADGQLMMKPVAQLTDEDIVAISAYIASLAP